MQSWYAKKKCWLIFAKEKLSSAEAKLHVNLSQLYSRNCYIEMWKESSSLFLLCQGHH